MANDRESRYYLTNKNFLEELTKYKESKIISETLGEMFQMLAKKIANRSNFYRYTFKEDMISEGILTCIKYIDNFNPEKSKNPFSYFTTTIYHSFVSIINREKKQSKIKEEMKDKVSEGHSHTPPKRIKFNEEYE